MKALSQEKERERGYRATERARRRGKQRGGERLEQVVCVCQIINWYSTAPH